MKYTVMWFDYDKEDTEITTEEAEDDLQIFMDVFDHPNNEKGLEVISEIHDKDFKPKSNEEPDEIKEESKKDDKEDGKSNEVESSNYKFPEVIYVRYDNANMKYVYICTHCDSIWKTNEEL